MQTSDLHLSGVPGTSVTAVNVINGNMTAEFTIQINSIFSGTLTINLPAGRSPISLAMLTQPSPGTTNTWGPPRRAAGCWSDQA